MIQAESTPAFLLRERSVRYNVVLFLILKATLKLKCLVQLVLYMRDGYVES